MGLDKLVPCTVKLSKIIQKSACDVICVIDRKAPSELADQLNELRNLDKGFDNFTSIFKSPKLDLPVVYSPIPELTDYDDVRSYQKAAAQSIRRAIKAGYKSPMLLVPNSNRFPRAQLCTVLGALEEVYVPIQLREDKPEQYQQLNNITFHINLPEAENIVKEALIFESGRFVARDIGVGDPERMAPPRIEQYVKPLFPMMGYNVIDDVEQLKKEYPLFAAVNRAANTVDRHKGRIIYLRYSPIQKPRKTLLLVGKGVTYDTGGADIKAGGIMAGMSRDKCGAAAVAGFMQIVNELKPCDIEVIAALCLVRNSVGEESYVSDEIITSRAGVRVRVGNTDAEGRMCMADAVCYMKEMVVKDSLADPHIFTIATLTGHAVLAAGEGYSIVVDNSTANEVEHASKLQKIGQEYGEPFEVSRLRPDDFEFNAAKVIGEDLIQCNNLSSSRTPRGHQVPVAFIIKASGLDKHDFSSSCPIKYSHLDIAGSAGEYPKMPTAAPIVALAKAHLL